MQAEGQAVGDWLEWDYRRGDERAERVFQMANRAFFERNFASGALSWQLMSTRLDTEIARHFHPDRYQGAWLAEARQLSSTLGADSAAGLRRLIARARSSSSATGDREVADELAAQLRDVETTIREQACDLERRIREALGVNDEVRTTEAA
jgi:transglutaminase-like putative cysteine protease